MTLFPNKLRWVTIARVGVPSFDGRIIDTLVVPKQVLFHNGVMLSNQRMVEARIKGDRAQVRLPRKWGTVASATLGRFEHHEADDGLVHICGEVEHVVLGLANAWDKRHA